MEPERLLEFIAGGRMSKPESKSWRVETMFSERAKRMKASEIRELLKLTQQPDVISFAGGLPNPESFPVEEIHEICNDVFEQYGSRALQYGTAQGLTQLREVLATRLYEKEKITATADNILITSGSQQGLDLLCKIFLDPEDKIIVSAPTYIGGTNAYTAFQAVMISVPLDNDGMNVDALETKLRKLCAENVNPKFLYVIPTFQNPTGVTMPLKRRKKLYELACEYDLLIVEDNPYGELRYEGKHVPPIKALDDEGRVMYFGTFSKILAPGFRLAWVVANEDIIDKLVLAKECTDVCSNILGEYIAYEFINRNMLDGHIEKIKRMYYEKRNIMLKALDTYFPPTVKWTRPKGGLFIWVTCPKSIDTAIMFQDAIREKVAYVVGHPFYPDGSGHNTMRLNFSHPSNDKIEEGVRRLGNVIKEYLVPVKREVIIGV
jgi:2-aminoadipate transaminase